MERLQDVSRGCVDIGMHALDRPIPETCVHATDYCRSHCYNEKLYKLYPAMRGKDIRNERAWQGITADTAADLVKALDRRTTLSMDRFRLMTRGEAFKDHDDIDRVKVLAHAMPERMVWVPTRAWRDPILRARIVNEIWPLSNVTVLASLDPSNTAAEFADLVSEGWSTMYFGKPGEGWNGPESGFDCPKTMHTVKHPKGIKGHCGQCKAGCFAPILLGRRVDVILQQH